ncbi:unnamed protein product [Polarella glacialis]|uniref:Major facilitator superfamily (MFS) profile domain-containing protein n=1 Tax=Polarella glacialis TaxID=89957 RepID=A0A813FSR2_POLGL|nr:unnamed protein product [Polarella glacialis]
MSRVCAPLPLHDGKCRGSGFSIATTSVEGHVERASKVRYHRSLILFACILGVVQYDLVTVIGLVTPDLESYYGLNPGEGDILYDAVNFGAFGLSFLPGMCYDHIGPAASMAVGTVLGVLSQLDWSPVFPDLDTMAQLYLSSLMFGLAACFFSVIAVLTPLEVFPAKHLGKTSAAIQVSLSLGVTLQSQVNNLLRESSDDFVGAYKAYALLRTAGVGMLMTAALSNTEALRLEARSAQMVAGGQELSKADNFEKGRDLYRVFFSVDFVYLFVFFFAGLGLVNSYLDTVEGINAAVGLPPSRATFDYGIYGAVGRIFVSFAMDFTGENSARANSLHYGFAVSLQCRAAVPSAACSARPASSEGHEHPHGTWCRWHVRQCAPRH